MISAGVIGWPVAHSKSPLIHRFWLGALGLDGDYGRFAVEPARLKKAVRAIPALGLTGVNVTLPHKVECLRWVDVVDHDAGVIGAANTILLFPDGRTCAYNTDMDGFAEPIRPLLEMLRSAVLIGAGGAARAVLGALGHSPLERLTIVNRDRARAARLARDLVDADVDLLAYQPGMALPAADLIVNATSLGMRGQPPLAVSLAGAGENTTVYDLVYAPLETTLLADARAAGLPAVDGLSMLIGQAALAFQMFYRAEAPRDRDPELRALLTG